MQYILLKVLLFPDIIRPTCIDRKRWNLIPIFILNFVQGCRYNKSATIQVAPYLIHIKESFYMTIYLYKWQPVLYHSPVTTGIRQMMEFLPHFTEPMFTLIKGRVVGLMVQNILIPSLTQLLQNNKINFQQYTNHCIPSKFHTRILFSTLVGFVTRWLILKVSEFIMENYLIHSFNMSNWKLNTLFHINKFKTEWVTWQK